MTERKKLKAFEIEALCLASLRAWNGLKGTTSVKIRKYSGPRDWTWEIKDISPSGGNTVIFEARREISELQQKYDLDDEGVAGK